MEDQIPTTSAEASGKTNPSAGTGDDSVLGRLIVERGLASDKEVRECLAQKQRLQAEQDSAATTLGDLLIRNGILTQRQLERIRLLLEEARPSQQIPGYVILEKLGAGAMAAVYKARQVSLDRVVAVKVLPKKYTHNAEFVARFYAEGRAAAKLNHPNIVQAIDVGQAGEYHYFVMEYVKGHTVFDVISSGKRYSEAKALNLVIQIATALEHAHKAGFIHRDVKPKNIMITDAGEAKLADMGLARAVSDREAAEQEQGKAYGTPYYISPEQIRGELNVDFRTDIYSLGATFYHMVTGQVPFDGPNPSAVMHKHLKSEVVPPDRINPSLSTGTCEIIEVCLAKDRNKRYNTTTDLLEDLQAVARGEPPVQARKKFDLSSLTALEQGTAAVPVMLGGGPSSAQEAGPFYTQPLFFVALAGWLAAAVLLLILLLR